METSADLNASSVMAIDVLAEQVSNSGAVRSKPWSENEHLRIHR